MDFEKRKYLYSPTKGHNNNYGKKSRKGKYEAKMEFPEGWGLQAKIPSVKGCGWISSGTTQYVL